jgi:hypothetical protein
MTRIGARALLRQPLAVDRRCQLPGVRKLAALPAEDATVLIYFIGLGNGYVPMKSERLTATWEITDPWDLHVKSGWWRSTIAPKCPQDI